MRAEASTPSSPLDSTPGRTQPSGRARTRAGVAAYPASTTPSSPLISVQGVVGVSRAGCGGDVGAVQRDVVLPRGGRAARRRPRIEASAGFGRTPPEDLGVLSSAGTFVEEKRNGGTLRRTPYCSGWVRPARETREG